MKTKLLKVLDQQKVLTVQKKGVIPFVIGLVNWEKSKATFQRFMEQKHSNG